jgi:general stress protein YciG
MKITRKEKKYMAWFGDSKGHAEAGRKGGKSQGKRNNPGNFANDREKAKRAGRKGGSASNNRE